jgi:hypothetical protein
MKKTIVLVILACLLLIAGCTTPTPNPGSSVTIPKLTLTTGLPGQEKLLPMDGHMVHTTPNTTFDVSIESFELGGVQDNGDQELTIYIAAKNTGRQPLRLVWFSKLTDKNGKTYGGIGISHGGNGARSGWMAPNDTQVSRDYVNIRSDLDLATLSKGAVLDVYFMEKFEDNVPIRMVPDYHTAWTIDPGTISVNRPVFSVTPNPVT